MRRDADTPHDGTVAGARIGAGIPASGAVRALWRMWGGANATRAATVLVTLGLGLMFLEGAATVEVAYTVRPSYIVMVAACAVCFPAVCRGWARLPFGMRLSAAGLLAAYLVAASVGDATTLAGQGRAGVRRELVYLLDLVAGLACVGAIVGCATSEGVARRFAEALIAAATLAALYGIYQWPAFHFGWPLADLNNALNTNGLTYGSSSSGTGLLGWARVRSTFREPRLLATFLTAVLPLAAWRLSVSAGRERRLRAASAAAIGFALLLTVSSSSWGVFCVACLVAGSVWAISGRMVATAAVAGSAAALVALLAALTLVRPDTLSVLTGRDSASLTISTRDRTDAWEAAVTAWAGQPVFGHGPGQAAVQLAGATATQLRGRPVRPGVLGSAHGVPTAGLVDAGIVGFALWLAFLGAVVAAVAAAVRARPGPLTVAALAATLVSVLSACVAGDRIELVVWAMLGVALALTLPMARARR